MAVESSVRLRVDGRSAVRELNRVNQATNLLTNSVGKLGVRLAQLETARRFFKGFREADSAAAAVQTLGVNTTKLRKELLGVTAEIGGLQSQTQLLAASYDVASAGFNDAASAAQILKAASLGATGGLSDLNTVADATTSVLNAYGLSSDKAAKLVDGFIQTQNDGKIVVAQYARQIGRVAPIAAAAGVGIDELNAAISTVTAQGVPIEATFSGLNQVLANVLKPTAEASKVAKLLGIDFSTAAIKAKGFGGFLEEVVEKTGGSEVALTKLFGSVDALKALFPLVSGDLEVFNKNLVNQANSAGAAERAAETLGGTVTNQIQAIVNDMGTLTRLLDDTLGPVIKGLFGEVKKITGEFVKFFALIQNAPSALEVFKGNLASFFGAQSQGLDNLVSAVKMLDASTVETEEDAVALEASINRISSALDNLRSNTTGKQLIDRGLADEVTFIAKSIDELNDKLRELRAAGLGKAGEGGATDKRKSPLQQQIDALLASLSGGAKGAVGRTPEELAREAGEKRLQALKDQAKIVSGITEDERTMLELEVAIEGIERQRNVLGDDLANKLIAAEKNLVGQKMVAEQLTEEERERIAIADRIAKEMERQKQLAREIAQTIEEGIKGAIMGALDGSQSLRQSLSGILRQIGGQFLSAGIGSFATDANPSGSGLLGLISGKKANGGTVQGGRSYVVGERGPELFTPGRTGSIAPNKAIGGDMNVVVNVDASGTEVQGNQGNADQLGRLIGQAVQAELIKQRRPGGLLTR